MKNIKLKTFLMSTIILGSTAINNEQVVLANDNDTNNDYKSTKQGIVKFNTPVINGIKVQKKLIDINYSKEQINPRYIVIHDTDNRDYGADAMANRDYFANHTNANASAHYIIDDSSIVQALEDTWAGWHIGDGGTNATVNNRNSIGIELAVNAEGSFNKTYKTGIELTRYLMNKYNIPAQNVVMHNHASGKVCSKMMIEDKPNAWEEFKKTIAEGMPGEEFINDGIVPIAKGVINTSGYVNIRSTPSTISLPMSRVYKNKVMNIYGENNGFYKVDFMGSEKKYGYISKKFINITSGSIKNSQSNYMNKGVNVDVNKSGTVTGINQEDILNVRSGAGSIYNIVDSLTLNDEVRVNYENNGWYNITYDNRNTGFVSKNYIKVLDSNVVIEQVGKEGIISNIDLGGTLNVREGAGANYTIKDRIKPNTRVRINYKTDNGWYNISYNGLEGFISSEYVSLLSESVVKANTINKIGKVQDVSKYLNVRTGPSSSYSIKDRLGKDTKVTVNYEKDGWYNISYDGKIGYVSSSYININDVTTNNQEFLKDGIVNVENGSNLNIRSGAGSNYSILGTVENKQKLKIKSRQDGWYKVDFDGREAYVDSDYVIVGTLDNIQKGHVVNVDTNLNVRVGNSSTHSVIGYILNGEIVDILDVSGEWYKIEFIAGSTKKQGYVNKEFIQKI